MRSDLHDLDVHIHAETQTHDPEEGALRVSLDGNDKKAVWLPKKAIQFTRKTRSSGVVTASERLLYEKGLI